jgi:DNA-binding YbaB/EbfC family protein
MTVPGQPSMQDLLKQAQQMQQQLAAAQEELAAARIEGSAGGGLVTATVDGGGNLHGLVIDPRAVDPDDTETLADLVLAAVRDATTKAHEAQAQALGPLAAGLGGPGAMPGLG